MRLEFARSIRPCGLVSDVHSVFLRAVELQSSVCRRTPNECSANHMAEKNLMFVAVAESSLSSVFFNVPQS